MACPPFLQRLLSLLLSAYQKSDLPGKFWLYQKTKKRFGRFLIQHRVATGHFWVPLDQWCFWLEHGPENYYLHEFVPFAEQINALDGAVDFFDLGADIGAVSLLVASRCQNVRQIIAVEPNPNSYDILQKNLQDMAITTHAFPVAVSSFVGRAQLVCEDSLGSDHEGHLVPGQDGSTEVQTLDNLVNSSGIELSGNLVIKVDVEGQEVNALQGAQQTIASADNVVLLLEIHPEVLRRDGLNAEALFGAAENIRGFTWHVPGKNNLEVDRSIGFYEQVPYQQYDVIGLSVG
jgi:FkbM family methyltransferase